ncbi:MAG: outer membrane lipoprotein-sorting protein [Bacteroidetes bacterium GWA2_31_9b]|nr:MAG: outer membrane lipoprotein-sorting protein [Bacteroidetes bacterium GWA2_31_9b]
MRRITLFLAFSLICLFVSAQNADEIIEKYFENTGGKDAWNSITSLRLNASVNTPVGEIPLVIYNAKNGSTYVKITLQGNDITQIAFDGETAWGMNMMSMQAEKQNSENTENLKRASKEFPDPFLNYKEKGFAIELLGNEIIEGTECFKIKLTKTPNLVDGVETENILYYYFDKENVVPILVEAEIKSGPAKGNISQTFFSNYQEVNGIYFSFSFTQGLKGQQGQTITIKTIEINPEIDKSTLAFPES